VKENTSMNFLTDQMEGRSTLTRRCSGWVGGRHACRNLTEVSALTVG
jgi:hypothetical protein